MQCSFTIDTALGFDTVATQLRALADKLDGKAGASAAGKATVAAPAAAPAQAGATAGKPARTRATKEEMEARRQAEAAAAAAQDDGLGGGEDDGLGLDDLGGDEPAAVTLTLEQVIDTAKAFAQANGREKAGKILARFGCKSVRELKPENFAMAHKAFGG